MTTVILKTIYAGPVGNFPIGHTLELPEDTAQQLIDGGYAERVQIEVIPDEVPAAPVVEIETAMVDPQVETAAQPKAKARKA
jgi:hypothetical protein